MIRLASALLVVGVIPVWFTGCRDSGINVYTVPKESTVGHPAGSVALESRSEGELHWTVPESWVAKPASGMRAASFLIPGADGQTVEMSVVGLPGPAGGALANVNRWRRQLGLPPLKTEELATQSTRLQSEAGAILLVDFTGADQGEGTTQKTRLLGGVLVLSEKTWFFKVTGMPSVIAAAKPSVVRFLKSVHEASPH